VVLLLLLLLLLLSLQHYCPGELLSSVGMRLFFMMLKRDEEA